MPKNIKKAILVTRFLNKTNVGELHVEHCALRITFYAQCYSVLSSSTAHNSVNGVNLYNILD